MIRLDYTQMRDGGAVNQVSPLGVAEYTILPRHLLVVTFLRICSGEFAVEEGNLGKVGVECNWLNSNIDPMPGGALSTSPKRWPLR